MESKLGLFLVEPGSHPLDSLGNGHRNRWKSGTFFFEGDGPPQGVVTIRGLPRPLARAMERYPERLEVEQVRKAYNLAAEAHTGQKRASGEDYVNHVVEVATLLAQFKLDTASLVAALIHDVVEDTSVTLTEIEEEFGYEVGQIVDGVTKIGKVEFRSHTEQQVENYRKLLLSMAQDAPGHPHQVGGPPSQHEDSGTPGS